MVFNCYTYNLVDMGEVKCVNIRLERKESLNSNKGHLVPAQCRSHYSISGRWLSSLNLKTSSEVDFTMSCCNLFLWPLTILVTFLWTCFRVLNCGVWTRHGTSGQVEWIMVWSVCFYKQILKKQLPFEHTDHIVQLPVYCLLVFNHPNHLT